MAHPHRKRVEDQLRRVLSELIARRVKDPRIEMVGVTRVEMSPDLRYARVYLSVIGDESKVSGAVGAARRAAGFLRGEVGRAMRLRVAPELRFFLDETLAAQERIEALLRDSSADGSAGDRSASGEDEDS
jgi:ribosome-binding factor A